MSNPFALEKGTSLKNVKLTCLDSVGNLCCYGDTRGKLYVTQLDVSHNVLSAHEVHSKQVLLTIH